MKQLRKAVILAGGFGSRMKELTKNTPKPMLPLQGKRILEYAVDLFRRYGITDLAISVHYLKDQIKDYFGNGSRFGVNIIYIEENEPLGTAGALRLAQEWLDEPFIMCNADELKDLNLQEMYEQHCETDALVTLALTAVEDPSQYGVVEIDGLRVKRFVEKPKKDEAPSNLISAGLYIIDPVVVKRVPEGFCMVEKNIFPQLAQEGKLFGFEFKGQWFDTGTPERYAHAQLNWKGFKEQPLLEEPAFT
ncbi:MAG TPA: nucleotidyltransferase family protein [Candidatus Nanoarchaeia archaeon]|nr:nucleotidyltransferase family protein [Candidatus Nanoarchaeia archaeon]